MLEIKNITFSYPKAGDLFKDLTFSISKGELGYIKGSNGKGKTTLLNCISGQLLIKDGEIALEGKSVDASEIGFMPSNSGSFFDNLTGRENLEVFIKLNGLDDEYRNSFMSKWSKQELFSEIFDKKFLSFSDGMKQKLNFLRAIIGNKKVLVFDEPFKSLDKVTVQFIEDFLKEIVKDKYILLTSHQDINKFEKQKTIEL